MARFEMGNAEFAGIGAGANADILLEMGLACATGRGGTTDMVAAHKWFNIAAIKGSARAAALRAEIAECMSKSELAKALRDARDWMGGR
ncbi:MAG: hypothetical protein NXH88_13845 [Hyphomonas sp.]|nr:hypothetical protein [Hyphomonas sp.]